jgi:Transposase DDE domain
MITDFDDFCLWVYYIVDEIYQAIEPMLGLRGPHPVCSNSELLAMSIIGECRGWDLETNLLSEMYEHRDLFPNIPEQSRFNRRRRNLMMVVNLIRQTLLADLDLAQDRQCVIDSLPVPVVHFHLVPSSTGEWSTYGADFGKVPSKKQTIFGYKLHLLITMGGVILDFELAGASIDEREIAVDMLTDHTDLDVIGDKGYVSQDKAAQLWHHNRIRLRTLPKRNQKQQPPPETRHLFNSVRQIIETVNGQLTEQFHLETNHAHTFWGLCTRLYTKLTAHTLCIYLNRLLGNVDFLQIKHLAFPN